MPRKSAHFTEIPLEKGLTVGPSWEYECSPGYLRDTGSMSLIRPHCAQTRARHPPTDHPPATGSIESLGDLILPRSDDLGNTLQLDLCDSIRAGLGDRRNQSPRWEEAMGFLATIMDDEQKGASIVDFAAIQKARLDKMLSDIVNPGNRPIPTPTGFQSDVALAERLIRLWRARFREHYLMIDQDRYHDLPRVGRLKDVEMYNVDDNHQGHWTARAFEPLSELEASRFEAGHWWLNLACAHRDGIVGSAFETPTKGRYGIAALPLVTGGEEICFPDGTVKYIREGKMSEMHSSLISQVGSRIRILRGHKLLSPLAPKAGLRYDGLYVIRQYGHKFNNSTELHRVVLTLERVKDQLPMENVMRIPQPSQLDDWKLFEQYEEDMIKQRSGQQAWLDWRMDKAQETIDREQYMRTLVFQTSLQLAKVGGASSSPGYITKTKSPRRLM